MNPPRWLAVTLSGGIGLRYGDYTSITLPCEPLPTTWRTPARIQDRPTPSNQWLPA